MVKRQYTLVFEKDEMLGVTVSYLEQIDGKKSTEPTDDIGRYILEDKVKTVSEMDLNILFKDPNEKRLEIIVEVDDI